eukprot:190225-Rhodomonas_salina.2
MDSSNASINSRITSINSSNTSINGSNAPVHGSGACINGSDRGRVSDLAQVHAGDSPGPQRAFERKKRHCAPANLGSGPPR